MRIRLCQELRTSATTEDRQSKEYVVLDNICNKFNKDTLRDFLDDRIYCFLFAVYAEAGQAFLLKSNKGHFEETRHLGLLIQFAQKARKTLFKEPL